MYFGILDFYTKGFYFRSGGPEHFVYGRIRRRQNRKHKEGDQLFFMFYFCHKHTHVNKLFEYVTYLSQIVYRKWGIGSTAFNFDKTCQGRVY